jgi:hypothetical protein
VKDWVIVRDFEKAIDLGRLMDFEMEIPKHLEKVKD